MNIFENLEQLNVSEECFEDILNIVEDYILERNKENRQKKKDWEINKTPEISPLYSERKKRAVHQGEKAIKELKKKYKDDIRKPHIINAVDEIARGIRANLGREQNPVSHNVPSEINKTALKDYYRKEQSQRGSTKDPLSFVGDKLAEKRWKKKKVSESILYNEIVDVIESIVDTIEQKYDNDINKRNEMLKKAYKAQKQEKEGAYKREGKEKVDKKRSIEDTKVGKHDISNIMKKLKKADEGPDDYGMQFVPVKKQFSGDDYDIKVAKYGN